jgi:GMP synthase (glutamine-hydrolysing)
MPVLIVDPLEWPDGFSTHSTSTNVGKWVVDAMQLKRDDYIIWKPQRERRPENDHIEKVVIAGSLSSVYHSDYWIQVLAAKVKEWAKRRIPMLGVCFGHQLIAQALGGAVEKNPNGWEVGRSPVQLTKAGKEDYLFKSLPSEFHTMQIHRDIVTKLPPKAECLALSPMTDIQAFRIGDHIRSIQFHPEFSPYQMQDILAFFHNTFLLENLPIKEIESGLTHCPESAVVFENFMNGMRMATV